MEVSWLLVQQIASMVLMGLAGYGVGKLKLITGEQSRVLSCMCIYLAVPCSLMTSFNTAMEADKLTGLLLALGLAMLDFIPIVGAGTIMVPWAFLALFTHDYAQAIQIMLIWGVIAMFRRVGEPKVVGDQTGLSPILSLVSIYVGMRLGGVLGMVLGPTVALIALNLVKLGLFEGLRLDLAAAAEDIMALLRERPEN